MIGKHKLYLKLDVDSRQLLLSLELIATIVLLTTGIVIAFLSNDVILWELSKAISLICTLNFLKIISRKTQNEN